MLSILPKTVLFFWVNAQLCIKGKGTDKACFPLIRPEMMVWCLQSIQS